MRTGSGAIQATGAGAKTPPAWVPRSAGICAKWQIGQVAEEEPGASTCHSVAPLARKSTAAIAAVRAAQRNQRRKPPGGLTTCLACTESTGQHTFHFHSPANATWRPSSNQGEDARSINARLPNLVDDEVKDYEEA